MEAAASIAGLVALTDLVFRRTSSFVKHAKGAEGEIKTLQAEIRDLAGILKSLELVLEQFDGESDARCSMRLHLVRSCHETLEKIRTRLQEAAPPNQATNHGKLLKKLKWPYSLSETMELVDQISRHKLTITTALSADSLSQLVNVLGGQENIEKEIVELGDRLQKRWDQEDLIALSETRKKILDTYTKGEPYQQHYASLQLRHPETGRWLLQSHEYVHWSTTANGKLWLYGIPGAGKTVLMSMVIEEAMKHCSPGNAVAYFYCDYKEPETHQPANILSTLASQLARQNEEAMLKLQAYHDTLSTPSRLPKPSTTESLLKLIGEMAIDFNEVAILIDGLDECGDMTESVVGSLVGLENSAATIKTLFASRDEQSIRYQLEDHEKLSVSARTEDLELYVAAEVELRIRKRKLRLNPKSTSLKDYIIETLIHKADGMFRWVTCQIDYLCALPTDSERRKALESLPPDLKSTYKRILRRLQSQPVCTQRLVRRTLKWLLFSATAPTEGYILPLTSSGLCEAISIEFGKDDMETESIPSEEEVLRCCSSFVRSSFAPGPPELRHLRGHYIVEVIELAHFSVKEFFTELSPTDDPEFSEFCMDKDQSTVELVQACLTYLNFRRFGNPGLDHLETFETLVETSPFLPHAVDCWSLYFQNRWSDGSSRSLLQQLFEPATLSRNLIFYLQARYWRLILRNHLRPEISLTEIAAFHQGLRSMTPLHVAALSLQPDLCQWLLDSGCGVNEPSYFGFPLHVTIAGEVLEDVHRSGGVEQIDFEFTFRSHPRYPEQYAQVVDVLVSAGAKLEIGAGLLSQSALQLAVTVAPWKAVALLKSGASPDDGVLQTLLNICADKLLLPSSWGRDIIDIMPYIRKDALTGTVKARFLELSFLVDYQNSPETLQELQATLANQREHQWDSLLHAVKSGKRELVAGLLTSGRFSLHQIIVGEDEKYYGHIEGETLLHYAARWKYLDLIKLLLAIDPTLKNVRDVDMNTPLHSIADPAGIEQIRETAGALLQCGMRSYAINERGWTVWHSACAYGNLELIEALCEYDTDMNVSLRIRDNEGRSPLDVFGCQRFYSAYGNPRVHQALHRLLVLCPNETLGHTDGSTPLHHWVENKFNEPVCIKMLVDSGINPAAARPSDGKTAAHLFYPRQKLPPEPLIDLEELVDYLRPLYSEEIGATAAHDGRLPIHELCASVAKMDPEVFDAFVTLGTAPTVKDRSGRSCLELIVEYLRSEGVDFDSPETQAKAASFIQRVIYHIKEEEDLRCVFESSDVIYALACSAGNDTLIESLLEKRFPVDVGKTMATGFQSACKFSSPEIIRKMLHQTSHQSPYNGLGLAGLACGNNAKFGALSLLISQGCDPNEEYGANRMTPLMIAAQNGREHELGILLESGASISSRDCSGMNALHMAVAHGHDNMTRMLLDEGHDVNSRDGAGMTALHVAVSKGFPLMTLVLLSRGAKIEIKNYEGHTPYQMALDGEKYDIAERLLNWTVCTRTSTSAPTMVVDADPAIQIIISAFSMAVRVGLLDQCKYLVMRGVDINHAPSPNEGGCDCGCCAFLILALCNKQYSVSRYLIELGANLESLACTTSGFRGFTPYHFATLRDAPGYVLDAVLKRGLPSHIEYSFGPIHLAVAQGNMKAARSVIEHAAASGQETSAMLNCKTDIFWDGLRITGSSLHIAAVTGNVEAVNFLLEHGARLEETNSIGDTALHTAAGNGKKQVLEALIAHGANINPLNAECKTPILLAIEYEHEATVSNLVKAGADLNTRRPWGNACLYHALASTKPSILTHLEEKFGGWHKVNDLSVQIVMGTSIASPTMKNYILNAGFDLTSDCISERRSTDELISHFTTRLFRGILLRLRDKGLKNALNSFGEDWDSPLYTAAAQGLTAHLELMLCFGADIHLESGQFGTALMGACEAGCLETVTLLVRRGAAICYEAEGGRIKSGIALASAHPNVVRWILVSRWTEQSKLEFSQDDIESGPSIRPWAGFVSKEIPWSRPNGQSQFDYLQERESYKKSMEGESWELAHRLISTPTSPELPQQDDSFSGYPLPFLS